MTVGLSFSWISFAIPRDDDGPADTSSRDPGALLNPAQPKMFRVPGDRLPNLNLQIA